jgi:hypothetical protein
VAAPADVAEVKKKGGGGGEGAGTGKNRLIKIQFGYSGLIWLQDFGGFVLFWVFSGPIGIQLVQSVEPPPILEVTRSKLIEPAQLVKAQRCIRLADPRVLLAAGGRVLG